MNTKRKRITREQKQYREYLNKTYGCDKKGKGRNNRYKPSKRPYGDYLWHCDRDMFIAGFEEWLKNGKVQ